MLFIPVGTKRKCTLKRLQGLFKPDMVSDWTPGWGLWDTENEQKQPRQLFSVYFKAWKGDKEKQPRLTFNKSLWPHVSECIYKFLKSWLPSFLDAEALWNFPLHPLILVKSLVFPVLETKGNPASIKEKVKKMIKILASQYLISN